MTTIRMITDPYEQKIYESMFKEQSGHRIPASYLFGENAKTIGAFDKTNRLVGGFSIVQATKKGLSVELRTVRQIPFRLPLFQTDDYFSELTGYFIKDKKAGFSLTLRLVAEVSKLKSEYFVYSYDTDNKMLEKYYSVGKPMRIYSGGVMDLRTSEMQKSENVEILDKKGIMLLFVNRSFRILKKRFFL